MSRYELAALKLLGYLRLGPLNLLRVFFYRLQVRSGWFRLTMPVASPLRGPYFCEDDTGGGQPQLCYFGWRIEVPSGTPDWFRDPFSDRIYPASDRHWSVLQDFDPAFGDIKTIWEPSRFGWLVDQAVAHAKGKNATALRDMERWLRAWTAENPTNRGPNWKCAQEAAIRVIHLAVASRTLGLLSKPSPALQSLLRQHCKRILPTMHYAAGQDNNHGTSEAAALFIAGAWLTVAGAGEPAERERLLQTGRRWLENRVARLIMSDGSFSQHSIVYHRMVLDTVVVAEMFRREASLPVFSDDFYVKARKATGWLMSMVDPHSGDAPNLGANDGTQLLYMHDNPYRDFRPSLQAASALFSNQQVFQTPKADTLLTVLGIPSAPLVERALVHEFPEGGYVVMQESSDGPRALLRLPCYKFRPSQADIHHLDVWWGGDNLLRDGGSYSYNTSATLSRYFSGAAGHNSVQFDDREPMRRVGRFLYADWPQDRASATVTHAGGKVLCESNFVDYARAVHRRHVEVGSDRVRVLDRLAGFRQKAVVRWRLLPGEWTFQGLSRIVNTRYEIDVQCDKTMQVILKEGCESRHYMSMTPLPVLEIEVNEPASLTTSITRY